MRPIDPTLRKLHYFGVSPFRGEVSASLGDEVTVPEHVATQLQAQSSQWKDGPAAAPDDAPAAVLEDEPEAEKPKPRKRATKKAAD